MSEVGKIEQLTPPTAEELARAHRENFERFGTTAWLMERDGAEKAAQYWKQRAEKAGAVVSERLTALDTTRAENVSLRQRIETAELSERMYQSKANIERQRADRAENLLDGMNENYGCALVKIEALEQENTKLRAELEEAHRIARHMQGNDAPEKG